MPKATNDYNSPILRNMTTHRNKSRKLMVEFSKILKERLSKEEIELAVSARSLDVPEGHLAVLLTLISQGSLPNQRLKAERIANEESIKYLQNSGESTK